MISARRLLVRLGIYYGIFAIIVIVGVTTFPELRGYLPVGGVQQLITQAPEATLLDGMPTQPAQVGDLGESLFWLAAAIFGALLTALPVSWVYMTVRDPLEYDQSLVGTIVMLPIVVTSIVIIVQNSLALAFSLAGIAGAVRFRNSLKSSGDALFILLAVGIGLSAGIGALELSIVMSVAFNICFFLLWMSEYGERQGMKRYLHDFDPHDEHSQPMPGMPDGGAAAEDGNAAKPA